MISGHIWKMFSKRRLALTGGLIVSFSLAAQHPHLLVKDADKTAVVSKISTEPWAKFVFNEMQRMVDPYVNRHSTDPQWILSRYLMNRVPGKHYTRFYSDEDGTALTRYEGDAPVATVRVSPHKRPPITSDGYGYKMPSIEELVPNDTSMKMWLTREAPDHKKEWVDPQSFVEGINRKINELALQSSIIYWLTGQEKYAVFAADILNQWAKGAYYQNPIEGPCRTGFLSIQTLGDANYAPLTLTYDFIYDFLRAKKYDTSPYETVFNRIAATMTFRGYWNNNWFAAQSPTLVYAALSLENKEDAKKYLQYVMERDTVNGACGHLALPSVVSKWLTPDGHWKEPGGYHNFPISSLLTASLALENNGYNVFGKFPALFGSAFVLLKYSFPNFSAPSIGDTGPVSQSPDCLEMGLLMAHKYNPDMEKQLSSAMQVMVDQKGYQRSSAGWLGLLCYLPQIPSSQGVSYQWPRSGELDFAKCYLQRNGSDQQNGLMYVVQGATYNHNHANGMSLELYGAGQVMGIDPGKGLTYEAPMHVNYYAQFAGHNTVISGSASASVPYFKGGGGEKKMGAISLESMEPLAGKQAVSPKCSFTDTRYKDISTNTNQQRTLAIVRTSATSGYYIDLYRSDNPKNNIWIYHNIGDTVLLQKTDKTAFPASPAKIPLLAEPSDPPGLRFVTNTLGTGQLNGAVAALFKLESAKQDKPSYMRVLMTGSGRKEYFAGEGPPSGTAIPAYRNKPTPVLMSRQEGEAWTRPFIALYEPYNGTDQSTVKTITEERSSTADYCGIRVQNNDGSDQLILQSVNGDSTYRSIKWTFTGHFGVISTKGDALLWIYLGEGKEISWGKYKLSCVGKTGGVNLAVEGGNIRVSCNSEVRISIKESKNRKVSLTTAGATKIIPASFANGELSIELPVVQDAIIHID